MEGEAGRGLLFLRRGGAIRVGAVDQKIASKLAPTDRWWRKPKAKVGGTLGLNRVQARSYEKRQARGELSVALRMTDLEPGLASESVPPLGPEP